MISKILIIDDEEHMCWALEKAMRQEGYTVDSTISGLKGLEMIKENPPAMVLLDLKMPEISGMDVLTEIKKVQPKLPVIILTAHGTIETAIEAMKIGASDYITKPFDLDELKIIIKQNLQISRLETEVKFLRSEIANKYTKIIGHSKAIQEVIYFIERISATNATVLITGESGTGKEVVAVTIHQNSPCREGPFVPVNCAALPENLLESELFGHEKGAFTGAIAKKIGRFELANKGTIFLDEIAEMPLSMQVKLLRVIQERSFERLGGTETIKVEIRIIAATNKDLKQAIERGEFREDLFYRLNVINIHLPPLRERKEDISVLAEYFLKSIGRIYKVSSISANAIKLMSRYQWPGNVRELQNVIERAAIICQGDEIKVEHLPKELLTDSKEVIVSPAIDFPDSGISLEGLEKELILKALEKSSGNQTRAAQLLGISRSALLYRSQKHGII